MKKGLTILLFLAAVKGYGQSPQAKSHPGLPGKYSDFGTELELRPDSTFILKASDPILIYTHIQYQTHGIWTASDNRVILNPDKEIRRPTLSLLEKSTGKLDSIQVKINYFLETYENEKLVGKTPSDFHLLTVYINKPGNYRYLVHSPIRRHCSFAPRIKRQVIVDSANTITLPRQTMEKIGINTFGFGKAIELPITNPDADFFEITIIQPVDKEGTQRNKPVIIKSNYAYFYERQPGKIPTGWMAYPLKRIK